jgi:hypothetical protein
MRIKMILGRRCCGRSECDRQTEPKIINIIAIGAITSFLIIKRAYVIKIAVVNLAEERRASSVVTKPSLPIPLWRNHN